MSLKVKHLPRTESNLAPLFLTMKKDLQQSVKPFKFFVFWVEDNSLIEVVRQHWKTKEVARAFGLSSTK